MEALKAAANDGIDLRLLVPRASDIPIMRAVSRAGFRGLLEGGVRIFEWTGHIAVATMLPGISHFHPPEGQLGVGGTVWDPILSAEEASGYILAVAGGPKN